VALNWCDGFLATRRASAEPVDHLPHSRGA
jgi:hypothetical protein